MKIVILIFTLLIFFAIITPTNEKYRNKMGFLKLLSFNSKNFLGNFNSLQGINQQNQNGVVSMTERLGANNNVTIFIFNS